MAVATELSPTFHGGAPQPLFEAPINMNGIEDSSARFTFSPDGQRALVIADSGNGASLEIDVARWFSLNTELTVHLHREPAGEWICLDAQTTITPGGAGLATSALSDLDGPVGVAAQSLLITPRQAPPAG